MARLGVLAYHPRSAAEASTNSNGNFLEWSKSGLPHVQESAYFDTGMEDNQFAGKLFMRPGHGGHQFVMHYLDAMFKDGEEGEPVFLPVKTKEQQQREDKLSKTNDAAKISGVKTVPAKLGNVSRLWRYRGGRLIQD